MKKITIIFIVLFILINFNALAKSKTIRKENKKEIEIDLLNDRTLYHEIINKGILYPDIAFSQALYESAHFKSNIAKKNKNLFGMRPSNSRKTTYVGVRKGYAVYSNWRSSVEDYKLWQDNIPQKVKASKKSYYEYVQRRYSHTRVYCKKIKGIIKSYQYVFNDTSWMSKI